jgi:hypothetical protein
MKMINEKNEMMIDNTAVDKFAAAMKEKLAAARLKGRGGWHHESCTERYLNLALIGHLAKGNPGTYLDIANFAMFLHQRGHNPLNLKEAFINSQVAPVAPNLYWNKGDEYTFEIDGVGDWAADNDYVDGDEFELSYCITGEAKFKLEGEDVKLLSVSPEYFTTPQQSQTVTELKLLLERAQNGLRWYEEAHPEDNSPADDELHEEIDRLLTADVPAIGVDV